MKKLIMSLACVSLFIFLFNSCASTSSVANKITIESGEIPPDMKIDNFTLIGTLKGRKNYDKYVEKEFANYTGKYILATEEEIKNKYNDINEFRYIMDYHQEYGSIYINGNFNTTTGYRYFIFDRKENKEYCRKSRSGFFALEMQAYLMAIEANRKK